MSDATQIKDRVQLVEIIEVPNRPGSHKAEPHWKVVIAYSDSFHGPILQATYYLLKRGWPDEALLPLSRNWFHRLCKEIADQTPDWFLSEDQVKALKRPQPKSQS